MVTDRMKPTTRQEKVRFAENALRDLTAMAVKHSNEIREEFLSLVQEFEDRVTELRITLPKDFLQLSINEVHSLGCRFPEVIDCWEDEKRESIKKKIKTAMKIKVNSPVTPKTPRIKLGKRNSLSRCKKFVVKVEGVSTPGGSIKWDFESLRNFELARQESIRSTRKGNITTGPITRSHRKK